MEIRNTSWYVITRRNKPEGRLFGMIATSLLSDYAKLTEVMCTD